LTRRLISKIVRCPSCVLSYIGTMTGCLKTLGVDCDIVDVGGYSGYAFIVNVTKGQTHVSGPTALPKTSESSEGDFVWNEIIKGTESLGWTIEKYHDPGDCEILGREPKPEERARMRRLFEKVKVEVDGRDRPVVVWGLPVPDYGVAEGYDDDSYLVTTEYGDGRIEDPVPYDRLQAPGRIQALFFRDRVWPKAEEIERKAIERAVMFASMTRSDRTWVMGPTAWDAWADALQNLPGIADYWSGYGGNGYVAQCIRESRHIAAEFLKRLPAATRMKNLRTAAKCYEKELALMDSYTRIFPYKWPIPDNWRTANTRDDLKKGEEILRGIRPLEEEALISLKRAIEEW